MRGGVRRVLTVRSIVTCGAESIRPNLPRRRHPQTLASCRIHSTRYPRNEYISTGYTHFKCDNFLRGDVDDDDDDDDDDEDAYWVRRFGGPM